MDETKIANPTPEPDIAALLVKIRQGDRGAFMTIVRTYQQKVFVMAYSILRNKEDALDAVQETFLKLYQKADMYKEGCNFQGWLIQIAKNVSIDYYRKHRQKRQEWETADGLDEGLVAAPEAGADTRKADLGKIFARGIDTLAERQKAVFVMRHYNELQFNEIASALKISVGTAKSLHFKAVQNLKKRLAPYMGMTA